jgi:hypothetical protein
MQKDYENMEVNLSKLMELGSGLLWTNTNYAFFNNNE